MDRQTALQLLAAHKPLLVSRFGITQLALFGSTARDAAHQGSDIDVLVSFDGPASSAQYFGVLFYLQVQVLGSYRYWGQVLHSYFFNPSFFHNPTHRRAVDFERLIDLLHAVAVRCAGLYDCRIAL